MDVTYQLQNILLERIYKKWAYTRWHCTMYLNKVTSRDVIIAPV